WEILQDLEKNQPMARLLEGDVGSGKTVTAALAMLNVALNKKQSALLVPTEILAAQHYETLIKLFKGVDINIGLFTRSQQKIFSVIASLPAGRQGVTSPIGTTKQSRGSIDKQRDCFAPSHKNATGLAMTKKEMTAEIKDGKIDIIVGTHALLQEDIEFRDLALAIIDEQHRFGVAQRQTLRHKSGAENIMPHLLSMTATPIPRSLAQVIYGDLDLSIINELPKGRKKIATFLVPEFKRAGAYDFIKKEIASGRQAFVVCPLISPSDKLGVKSVEEEYKKLNEHIFPELKIGCLHGKLKPAEKEKIMSAFASSSAPSDFEIFDGKKVSKNEEASADKQNRIDILVSTSVIEVGVDVPNASVMMIEGAERFGLAQLHQFRGRVGRSAHQSYCLLFTRTLENDGHKLTYENLSRMPNENKTVVASKKVWGFTDSLNEQTRARLAIFTKNSDGFKLAEADLKQRGPGEVYGAAQAGFPEFKIATLNDLQLIKETKEAAEQIVIGGIDKYPKLLERVKQEKEYIAG
ncbi:MAG: ATP-dependent DNA helicase RecG, partial [Patescibacteria group bacterium]